MRMGKGKAGAGSKWSCDLSDLRLHLKHETKVLRAPWGGVAVAVGEAAMAPAVLDGLVHVAKCAGLATARNASTRSLSAVNAAIIDRTVSAVGTIHLRTDGTGRGDGARVSEEVYMASGEQSCVGETPPHGRGAR